MHNCCNDSGIDKLSFVETVSPKICHRHTNDFVILVKGNSISRHGCNEKTIQELGWNRECGMAASCEENDYAHLLAKEIAKTIPERHVKLYFGQGGRPDLAIRSVKEEKEIHPDLIVIQNGEHSAISPWAERFESDFDLLLASISGFSWKPPIIVIGIWNPRWNSEQYECTNTEYDLHAKNIAAIQRRVCNAYKIPYVDVSFFDTDPCNCGDGIVAGVRWHPNDAGMRQYAKAAFAAYQLSLK